MQGSLLRSTPIEKMIVSEIKPETIQSLEKLGCRVTSLHEQGYQILFPPNTQEEIHAGEATAHVYKTHIRFAHNDATVTKLIMVCLSNMNESRTYLSFS